MPKVKDSYPRTSTWGDLSDKLVKHYRLPNGSRFALCRKRKSSSARPFVRADFEVRRKALRRTDHPGLGPTLVSDVCRTVQDMLAPASRAEVIALGPDGQPLHGNRMLKTWREMPGKVTQAERNAAEARRLVVEDLRRTAMSDLAELEEAVEDPDSEVTEAVMRALVDRYGHEPVRAAFQQLRL